jgi:tetratricopeptide (TPR) repeat protein
MTAVRDDGPASALAASARIQGLGRTTARQLEEAAAALQRRDLAKARQALSAALALAPQHPEVLRLLGLLHLLAGRPSKAVAALRHALSRNPGDALAWDNLGTALLAANDIEAAVVACRNACAHAPTLAPAWSNLGKALKAQADPVAAADAFRHVLQLAPDHIEARIDYANMLKAAGHIDNAAAEYRAVLQRRPDESRAWLGLGSLHTMPMSDAESARLSVLWERPAVDAYQHAQLGFALARALEDRHEYAQSFMVLTEANRARGSRTAWNRMAFSHGIDAILAACDETPPPAEANRGWQVIFIVGLPRSGSTVVEQILSMHPEVDGAGELPDLGAVLQAESARRHRPFPDWVSAATPADWARLGDEYLARTARWRKAGARFTDKALLNWQFIGVIARMLPGARFIDCRRDPLETCLSCWRQWFQEGQGFACDFESLAAYWHDYERVLGHWLATWPDRIHRLDHETLLAEPEGTLRALLAFCDLPFDSGCLAFHRNPRVVSSASAAQVREPLRLSTARAQHYGTLLDPLRAALARAS